MISRLSGSQGVQEPQGYNKIGSRKYPEYPVLVTWSYRRKGAGNQGINAEKQKYYQEGYYQGIFIFAFEPG